MYFPDEQRVDSQHEDVDMMSVDGSSESINARYEMDRNKMNLAFIINNETFNKSTKMPQRQGSDKDASAIEKALKSLHFQVFNRKNLTVKDMKQIFTDISTMKHEKYNCFVCVILTHGEDGNQIYGTDGPINLGDLLEMLHPDRCPSLVGKPKVFFIQACRGEKVDSGAIMHDAGSENVTSHKVPLWPDVFLVYSTVPGFRSWRRTQTGSWFIQSLAQILEKDGDRLELQQLMISVNRKVAYEYESSHSDLKLNEKKQVPCIASMLTKELYFYK